MKNIEVSKIIDPIPASDGAGVKLKRSFFVHANKQIISLFVMVHIIKSNIEIINLLTTSKS